ncbi:hypothetical protein [Streptomyces sp. ALI-76-A]|uniref:hypothetical protein n=1 Tax=Streptomyces sp. ALI-76-A TaxID=3025736 RepID=UPI00256EC8DC|nr:hypothetical protein [Streptomyces sp. ALI-76-A]MDL5199645.1 hypothetical protein [Streptomyces sp. ALI-76-A]
MDDLVEPFCQAALNGRGAAYENKRLDAEMWNGGLRRVTEMHGKPFTPVPVRHQLRCDAPNWRWGTDERMAFAPTERSARFSNRHHPTPSYLSKESM